MLPRDEILEELLVAAKGDDRQTFSDRDAQPARMVEMVMGDDRVRQRLRTERPRLVDDRLRSGLVHRHLEQREMVVELEHDAAMIARTGKPPDALATGSAVTLTGGGGGAAAAFTASGAARSPASASTVFFDT